MSPAALRSRNLLLGLLALLTAPALVRANMGPRWHGDSTMEPRGVAGVSIRHEELRIDLRPLGDGQPARVEAVYLLHNPGEAQRAELVFVSGTEIMGEFEVRLNGRIVRSRSEPYDGKDTERLPKKWLPPQDFQGFDREKAYVIIYPYGNRTTLLLFDVDLPAGISTLSVRYKARAAGADERHPTATWFFPYVLAPARAWGGFGGLDVTVNVPQGWESRATPPLEREGDVLRGHFDELPADMLVLAVRAPVPQQYHRTIWFAVGAYVLALFGGGVLCWLAGAFIGRRVPRGLWFGVFVGSAALVLSSLWAASLWGVWVVGFRRAGEALGAQESPYFHEQYFTPCFTTFWLTPVVLVLGVILTRAGANRARRRAIKGHWLILSQSAAPPPPSPPPPGSP
jgi:hypothetical protein